MQGDSLLIFISGKEEAVQISSRKWFKRHFLDTLTMPWRMPGHLFVTHATPLVSIILVLPATTWVPYSTEPAPLPSCYKQWLCCTHCHLPSLFFLGLFITGQCLLVTTEQNHCFHVYFMELDIFKKNLKTNSKLSSQLEFNGSPITQMFLLIPLIPFAWLFTAEHIHLSSSVQLRSVPSPLPRLVFFFLEGCQPHRDDTVNADDGHTIIQSDVIV